MLKKYEKFLEKFDKKLEKYFKNQSEYISCKEGCSGCCEVGDYPFTQLEMMYLMQGFKTLPAMTQAMVRNNLLSIKKNRVSTHFFYQCPFLINNRCSVYKYRGLTCRTFGLAYLCGDKTVKLPECVHQGLCYSKVMDGDMLTIEPIKESLSLTDIINSPEAKELQLEFGMSRSLVDWFPD